MPDNPKWSKFLDAIPSHLHDTVKPILAEWDQGVQQLVQGVRDEYKPLEGFKQFADGNIDPGYLVQAYQLAEELSDNPAAMVERMNETFNLGFVPKSEIVPPNDDPDLELDDMNNIQDHPEFKALKEGITALTTQLTNLTEQQQTDRATADFENYLKELHESDGEFNDRFVTALIAQGLDGKDAIEEYRKEIGKAASNLTPEQIKELNSNNQQQNGTEQGSTIVTPPVTLGGEPAGSGSEQQQVDFGNMQKGKINSYVEQLLAGAGTNQQ